MKAGIKRKLQIGVIGSAADLGYDKAARIFAMNLGKEIAKTGNTLVFGAEKDVESLPTVSARAARGEGGLTVGVTYEKGTKVYGEESASVVIATGMVRGGGRETALMLSCDTVIAIAGGSGTLNELCVAYQAGIPVVLVEKFGGWSKKLAGDFLDQRKRYRYIVANTPEQAVQQAIYLVEWRQDES